MRRAVHAERTSAHVGAVEIELQDFVLAEPRLEPDGEERFLDLALDRALVVQEKVLGELLCNRGAALSHAAGLCVRHQRAGSAREINAEVVVKAPILSGKRRLDQVVRKILERNRVIVLDAAAADRIAVAIEERDGEI